VCTFVLTILLWNFHVLFIAISYVKFYNLIFGFNRGLNIFNMYVQGDFGPFRPQIPAKVPLWLAIALKKRGKCRIQPPNWMTVGKYG
jgi:hypothetical protein